MKDVTRREALKLLAAAGAVGAAGAAGAGCSTSAPPARSSAEPAERETEPADPVIASARLGMQWPTRDPFLFCVHHDDHYPRGDGRFGPAVPLDGRELGNDFEGKDGFRMYHGRVVPGFPRHPHRGFETVTVVRRGLLDHADSLGAAARYGEGDVQWLTAGDGIQHAEMFPLLHADRDNPLELFQIWLNLPAESKRVPAHFSMFWHERIPRVRTTDAEGRTTELTVIAGRYAAAEPLSPPPNSWAARPNAQVAIWSIAMQPHARFTLPAAEPGLNRSLYVFRGDGLHVSGRPRAAQQLLELRSELAVSIQNGARDSEMLLLQGRPIAQPIARYGPFVMNDEAEIRQAYADYRRTQFGGWPWPADDPVHGAEPSRFARHLDGRVERPT